MRIVASILGLILATGAAPSAAKQSLRLLVRAPAVSVAVNEAIDLKLVFLNAGADSLVLLRPKPEQLLSQGRWDLRAHVWKGALAPQWVLEPSIVYSMHRTFSKRDFVTLHPGDSLVYPVRFGRGSMDLSRTSVSRPSACGWDVFAMAGSVRPSGLDRDDVLGHCFHEPGEYGIRFELGIGDLGPGWSLSGAKDLPYSRAWRGYLSTEPISIRITKP